MSASRDRVLQAIEPAITAQGYDLEDLQVTAAGRRRLVRVMVDGDQGLTLDAAAMLSRELSEVLDESNAMGETPYVLEVGSPGVDRPLTLPRHWRRAATRKVTITLTDPEADPILGRVTSSDDSSVTLESPDDGSVIVVAYDTIERAVIQVEFNRKDAPAPAAIDHAVDGSEDLAELDEEDV